MQKSRESREIMEVSELLKKISEKCAKNIGVTVYIHTYDAKTVELLIELRDNTQILAEHNLKVSQQDCCKVNNIVGGFGVCDIHATEEDMNKAKLKQASA